MAHEVCVLGVVDQSSACRVGCIPEVVELPDENNVLTKGAALKHPTKQYRELDTFTMVAHQLTEEILAGPKSIRQGQGADVLAWTLKQATTPQHKVQALGMFPTLAELREKRGKATKSGSSASAILDGSPKASRSDDNEDEEIVTASVVGLNLPTALNINPGPAKVRPGALKTAPSVAMSLRAAAASVPDVEAATPQAKCKKEAGGQTGAHRSV